ncbi:glycosyltransferase family 9 protein [Mucilaginibacter sp. E4BP6]|uniref:glycosyltransferase family 9 protein n=1 Tax=Mucilaginibacter sp. E4BP6 TaxID=2723089 RepID=UPI0015CC1BDC|nr:glycosyltransferase family 9 protein [Mucilaginibacter sp. E4BP6]NYE65875.1 ADP-heptose:LPS heptosyltransferase [Mucilaginibacter sp. E4BP6]
MPGPKHILVSRFSSMGDVAMTVPVLKALLDQNPGIEITYVSRPQFAGFFNNIPRLTYFRANLDKEFKGFGGIIKLYNQLKKQQNFAGFADLHGSLRTKVLRRLFRLSGVPYSYINKGREEKKLLTRFPNKILKPLKRTTERYADVFRELGFSLTLSYELVKEPKDLTEDITKITGNKTNTWIGISPFAKHTGKIFPLEKMEDVISELTKQAVTVFLFGGSDSELAICNEWALRYSNVVSVVRKLNIEQELALISQLDVMLSMDSAGMHMASLVGTPVVSIWGATHHFAGFLGYGQSEDDIVADNIECRPCSVYGDKPCFRGDYACLYRIETKTVIEHLSKYTTKP